jgi:hypothetical protein
MKKSIERGRDLQEQIQRLVVDYQCVCICLLLLTSYFLLPSDFLFSSLSQEPNRPLSLARSRVGFLLIFFSLFFLSLKRFLLSYMQSVKSLSDQMIAKQRNVIILLFFLPKKINFWIVAVANKKVRKN